MSLKGVQINKGQIGANVAGKQFQSKGMLLTGMGIAGTLELGKTYTLFGVSDAKGLGLTADYDTTNNVVVFEHISEYYRMAGEGKKLYLMIAPQSASVNDLITSSLYAKKMIVDAQGDIYTLGIGFNPDADYEETVTDGFNADIRAAIQPAQALYQWSYDTFRPCNIILEGRAFTGPAASVLNLRAIPATPDGIQHNDNVSIVIGQDYDFAETLTGLAQKHAALGTLLGTRAACDVNQNVGEVASFNLTDELKGKFKRAGLSGHQLLTSVEDDLETLDTKGYIFPIIYSGISGYRWNDDHTCTPIVVDAEGNMNAHTIAYGETLDFATRSLRTALLPEVKKTKPVDKKTGKLPTGVIKYYNGIGDQVFEDMVADGYISGGETDTDPDSDILVAKLLNVSFEVVPAGSIGSILGTINLTVPS